MLWPGAEFLAGTVAGGVVDAALFPLDTIRARVQVHIQSRGMLPEAVAIVRGEGFRALFKGLPVQLLASGPGCGIFYAAYTAGKSAIPIRNDPMRHSVAAAAACFASLAIFTPVEVVKQRTMLQCGVGCWSILARLLREQGIGGLYCGGFAGALTSVPYSACYFLVFEHLLSMRNTHSAGDRSQYASTLTPSLLPSPPPSPPPSFVDSVGCGLIAGALAAALTNPCDVVRTRIQVGHGSDWRAVATHIAKSEGVSGFCRGLAPRVLMLAPASALTIATFGWWMKIIGSMAPHAHTSKGGGN